MYLRELRIESLKLLRNVKVDFTNPDGTPRMWTVFVGENRLCKTTLLQAIAATAAGVDRGTALAANVAASWPDLRGHDAVFLWAKYTFSAAHHAHRKYPHLVSPPPAPPALASSLHLERSRTVFNGRAVYEIAGKEEPYWATSTPEDPNPPRPDPLLDARASSLPHWFVAAYGTSRGIQNTKNVTMPDPAVDRLRPLFGGDVIGTGFADLLDAPMGRAFSKVLQRVFVEGGLLPHVRTLSLVGRGGIKNQKDLVEGPRFEVEVGEGTIKVPAVWLSQGYQSLIAWLADVVGYILLEAGAAVEPEDMEGVVLIDEIDLHLHPSWQVRLIPALRSVFKKIQFVATTHSPMVLAGLAAEEVWLLEQDAAGSVTARQSDRSPALLTGSELLAAFFEIQQLYPNELGQKLRRYGHLANDPTRSAADDGAVKELRAELLAAGVTFDWEPVERQAAE